MKQEVEKYIQIGGIERVVFGDDFYRIQKLDLKNGINEQKRELLILQQRIEDVELILLKVVCKMEQLETDNQRKRSLLM